MSGHSGSRQGGGCRKEGKEKRGLRGKRGKNRGKRRDGSKTADQIPAAHL